MSNRYEKNFYSQNYVNPPIPEGFKHVKGEWNNGFVIERCYDGSQFVWVPVGSLPSNGTLDGKHFTEKFGRRNYMNDETAVFKNFYESLNDDDFIKQIRSVKKYGGFYISRYNISTDDYGKLLSVKGLIPLTNIKSSKASALARSMLLDVKNVSCHLTFGSEYDSVLAWFINSGAKERKEIVEDSTEWGNCPGNYYSSREVVKTGSHEEWCVNNIYDFSGNVSEWTQEENSTSRSQVIRGGNWYESYPVAYRWYNNSKEFFYGVGFHVTLCIE